MITRLIGLGLVAATIWLITAGVVAAWWYAGAGRLDAWAIALIALVPAALGAGAAAYLSRGR